jgi:hypothetical protein
MCYEHHVATNDVTIYSVERMIQIKEKHEKMFSGVVDIIYKNVIDHTTLLEPKNPSNLYRINRVLNWNCSEKELQVNLEELLLTIDTISKLPIPTRKFLAILLKRSMNLGIDKLFNSFPDVQQATGFSKKEMFDFISILENHRIVQYVIDDDDDDVPVPQIEFQSLASGWPFWRNLKNFCELEKLDVSLILEDLDFTCFDES